MLFYHMRLFAIAKMCINNHSVNCFPVNFVNCAIRLTKHAESMTNRLCITLNFLKFAA